MTVFARFAWSVLFYNIAVVAWGAFVRATGAGAGCGKHWPMCNGQVVPRSPELATVVELVHRLTSGLALVLVVALVIASRRTYARGHAARRAAVASLVLMLVEAGVGAGLVLFGWVARDTSPERGWVMAIHLTNTFLLLGALALTAHLATRSRLSLQPRGLHTVLAGAALLGMLVIGVTGAIAALGDTLFPAVSFGDGWRQETSADAHVLLRLRVLHPFAAAVGGGLAVLAALVARRHRPDPDVGRLAAAVIGLVGIELLVGLVNVALLAPVWLQLVHLVLADLTWVALVLLAAAGMSAASDAEAVAPASARAAVGR